MTIFKDGGPAFPHCFTPQSIGDCSGMSLRDYFATHASETDIAIQAEIIRDQQVAAGKLRILPDDFRVRARYMHADSMLAARADAAEAGGASHG